MSERSKSGTRARFIDWAKSRVGNIYVWGGQGESDISEEWIREMERNEANAKRVIAFWRKRQNEGAKQLFAYDCSGLIVEFLLANGVIHSDMTSRGLYAICGKLEKDELIGGDLVFRHDGTRIYHVGVYVGDGRVVHARGRDYGVVEESLSANGDSYWNRFGRITNMGLEVTEDSPDTMNVTNPQAMEYVGSTYVNLRSEPSSSDSDNIIGKVSRSDVVLLLGVVNDSWAEVVVRGENGFIRGYCVVNWLNEVAPDKF